MAYAPVQETLAPLVGGTPDEVERYRKLAEALMASAQSGEPVEHWMEGVGRLAQALSGTLNERKAGAIQREGEARGWEYLEGQASQGGGYGGGTAGGETADVPGAEPVAATGNDADMIIRTVIGEAAGEDPVGQQAVASVILNRARQSGKSPTEVVLAKNQFEPWGSRASQLRAIDPNSEQYRRVAAAVLPVLQGQARDPTGGATHFYAPKAQAALGRSTPSWARGQGQDIGNHRFYSLGYGGQGKHGLGGGQSQAQTAARPGVNPALDRVIQRATRDNPGIFGVPTAEAGIASGLSPEEAAALAPGLRTREQQQDMVKRGWSGTMNSPHLRGGASDLWPVNPATGKLDPNYTAGYAAIQAAMRKAAEQEGVPLEWGGDWKSPDRPHWQLPKGYGETADIPGAEPVGSAPSPEVMRHITGGGATPAGMAFAPPAVPPPAPVASVPPPTPIVGQDAPVAGPPMPPQHPLARVPQARPEPPVAPAAPATTGTVPAPAPARPVYAPPVKNDYNAIPGRPPAAMPMKPGQLMQEPYSGPMSAQEFARQGQAAMRAQKAGQQPTGLAQALTPGGQPPQQPPQPRRNLIQALFGRGSTGQPAAAQPAPAGSAAPAGGNRERLQAAMSDIAFLPPAAQAMAMKRLFPEPGEGFTLGPNEIRYGPDGRPLAQGPAGAPEKGTDDQREYQQAVSQGYTGSFVDYMREMKRAGATTLDLTGGTEKQIYETLGASADSARAVVTGLKGIQEARKAVEGGIITGAGANIRLPLQKLGALLGVADPRVIENTETFRAAIAPQVAAMLKATVGTSQISNTDREFAERAAGGDITLDEASIKRLLVIMDKAGRAAVETHRQKLDAVYPESGDYARERALFGVDVAAEEEPAAEAPQTSALDAARDAIARGADPEAVKRRLQENGIDPGAL